VIARVVLEPARRDAGTTRPDAETTRPRRVAMVRLGAVSGEVTPAPEGHAVTAPVPEERVARRGAMPKVEARTRADRPVADRAREVRSGAGPSGVGKIGEHPAPTGEPPARSGEAVALRGDRPVRSGAAAVLRGDRPVRSDGQVVPNAGPMARERADLATVIARNGRRARVRRDRSVRELRRRPDPRPLELGGRRSRL